MKYYKRLPVYRAPYFSGDEMIALLDADMPWEDRFTPCGMQIVTICGNKETAIAAAEASRASTGENGKAVPKFDADKGSWHWAVVALY